MTRFRSKIHCLLCGFNLKREEISTRKRDVPYRCPWCKVNFLVSYANGTYVFRKVKVIPND